MSKDITKTKSASHENNRRMVSDPRSFINEFEGELAGVVKPNPLYFTLIKHLRFECGPEMTENDMFSLTADAVLILLRVNRETGHGQMVVMAGLESYNNFLGRYGQTEFFVSKYFLDQEKLDPSEPRWTPLGVFSHARQPSAGGYKFEFVSSREVYQHMRESSKQLERKGW